VLGRLVSLQQVAGPALVEAPAASQALVAGDGHAHLEVWTERLDEIASNSLRSLTPIVYPLPPLLPSEGKLSRVDGHQDYAA
jgi:hypothetical protein